MQWSAKYYSKIRHYMNWYCGWKQQKTKKILIMQWFHYSAIYANLNNTDQIFLGFANKHLFYDKNDDDHLPIPVHSGIKPSMGHILFQINYYHWAYFIQSANLF